MLLDTRGGCGRAPRAISTTWGAPASQPGAAGAHPRRGGIGSDGIVALVRWATVLNLRYHRVR